MHQIVLMPIDRHVAHIVLVGEDQPGRYVVLALARVLIVLTLVVGLIALAVEAARRVGAVLRAGTRLFQAFVHIDAGFAIGKQSVEKKMKKNTKTMRITFQFYLLPYFRYLLVTLVAITVVARQGVHTLVAALIDLHLGALIHIAVCGLIGLICAVGHLVAHQTVINTLSIRAGKLSLCT